MKRIKPFILAVLIPGLLLLHACSSETTTPTPPAATTEPAQPAGTDKGNGLQPHEQTAQEPSRDEKLEALKALIPDSVPKIPETTEEFYTQLPGRYSGILYGEKDEEIEEILKQFPVIDNPDQETIELYYRALLGLFAEDYPDPQDIIDQIKLASFGSPEIDDPRFKFKEQYNVEILLDASGSMAANVNGQTKMEAAKKAIQAFAESLPEKANVALRVYGHKGSGKDSDKALSCGSSELVYQLQSYQANGLSAAMNQFKPTGWTPLALAMQQAQNDLGKFKGDKNTNIIYLVSDGIETCGGDPVAVAKQLSGSDITPIVNVVGFGVDGEGQKQLKEVAKAAGGRYVLIHDQSELEKEFNRAKEVANRWKAWKSDASYEANSTHISRSVDISVFAYDWKAIARNESYNMNSAIISLGYHNILPDSITDELDKIKEKQEDAALERADELEKFLDTLNDKSYKEAKEAIDKQFQANVKTN
ncbi:VWA domain-containing protein [Brevibacillus choshinensis]|uniref:VWA domain-containing protein n=1 Tax=Brevibacillus choshinensis TaxID=54911 RepID=A0ABX7FQ48_BRECH|nr:VWA domain-containing protein [Brevibacillus choshinensis]QRG68216.1 VWA domain-containing protein [Brevibacillus choshinensis]